MKKISKEAAKKKKSGGFWIKSTGTESKRKYQKPDFKSQLKTLKKKMTDNKPTSRVIKLEIIPEEMEKYNKKEPWVHEGWQVWRTADGAIMAMPENKKETERYYLFEMEEGYLYLATKPNGYRYAYFHTKKFQEFLERYGIHKVQHREPNGEYQGRDGVYQNTVSVFRYATDGNYTVHSSSQLRASEEPIVAMKNPTVFVSVEDATFFIFEQIAYRQDETNVEPYIQRQLITDYDIYELENEIAQACAYLDSQDEEVAEETAAASNEA